MNYCLTTILIITVSSVTQGADCSPVLVLPLNNVTFGFSRTGVPPIFPEHSQCFRQEGGVMMFDGSRESYIEHDVTSRVFQGNFTIAMMLSPAASAAGSVLHYEWKGEDDGVSDFELHVEHSDLAVTLSHKLGENCGELTRTKAVNQNNVNFIKVTVTSNTITLFVNSTEVSNVTQCLLSRDTTTTTGRLLVGGNSAGTGNFRGTVACVAVFENSFNGDVVILKQYCENNVTRPTDVNRENCDALPEIRAPTFRLKTSSAVPSAELTPLLKVTVTSKVMCSLICLRLRNCRSFSVTLHAGIVVCSLYDFETGMSGLAADDRSLYFGYS